MPATRSRPNSNTLASLGSASVDSYCCQQSEQTCHSMSSVVSMLIMIQRSNMDLALATGSNISNVNVDLETRLDLALVRPRPKG